MKVLCALPGAKRAGLTTISVSYTHLDVYKRQQPSLRTSSVTLLLLVQEDNRLILLPVQELLRPLFLLGRFHQSNPTGPLIILLSKQEDIMRQAVLM